MITLTQTTSEVNSGKPYHQTHYLGQYLIISSIKSYSELDWKLKLVSKTSAYKLFPAFLLKWSNKFTADYYFGTQSKEESLLLKRIIEDTDETFLKWAIDQLMKWNNEGKSKSQLVHIHGDADRIFPIQSIKNCITIKGGGHFMIVNKTEEISRTLRHNLKP